jgi:hypothetical protein
MEVDTCDPENLAVAPDPARPLRPPGSGSLGRLALYVLIPPMTRVGVALIENVVDALL